MCMRGQSKEEIRIEMRWEAVWFKDVCEKTMQRENEDERDGKN